AKGEVASGGYCGDHPIVGPRSLRCGELLLSHLRKMTEKERVLFIISGGTSALVDSPIPGMSESDFLKKNEQLYLAGLPIQELNRRRQEISQIKGGGLARNCRAQISTWILSD